MPVVAHSAYKLLIVQYRYGSLCVFSALLEITVPNQI